MMPHNSFVSEPTPYLRSLPDNAFVISDGYHYRIWGGAFAYHCVDNATGPLTEGCIDLRLYDPFSQGAVARLPTGLRYVRRGNIWLLAPVPATTPVILAGNVPGYEEYRVIQQVPYTGGAPVANPIIIPFNMPMSWATAGDFVGAHEPVFPNGTVRGKISISVNILTADPGNPSLKSSSQVNALQVTKGRLAKAVAWEVEKALTAQKNVLVAFSDQAFLQDLLFQDLFLVDLVRMSRSTYQPIIALRVRT